MAQGADPRIERFRKEVFACLRERFAPERVILFGSRVRGEALTHSDLDVLIVSAAFEGVAWLDRSPRVVADCDIRLGVELLCYTPAEFQRKKQELGIVRAAVDEGVDLMDEVEEAVGG